MISLVEALLPARGTPIAVSSPTFEGVTRPGNAAVPTKRTGFLARFADHAELGPRASRSVFVVILAFAAVSSILHAIAKPFWFDEMCTVVVSRLPGASAIWHALDHGVDSNPPGFYLLARLARQLVPDDHLAYRIPSIAGLLVTLSCVYCFLCRRVKRLSALVGVTFLLCTPLAAFAYEARPYALMVGCIAAAALAWQRIDDSRLYSLALAIALAAAASLHYYAIFAWPAFLVAEGSVWILRRRFRAAVWGALVAGTLPVALFARLVLNFRRYNDGAHFWAQPSALQAFVAHSWLFNLGGADYGKFYGWFVAVGITVALVRLGHATASGQHSVANVAPIEERLLTLMLLWLPVIAVAAAKIGHGGMIYRYMMPAVLGGALAVGFLVDRIPSAMRVLLLIAMMTNFSLFSVGEFKRALTGNLLDARAAATQDAKAILEPFHEEGLPVVVASGHQYLPMVYYAPAELKGDLYFIADPPAAIEFSATRTDSVDVAFVIMRHYAPLQIVDYRGFLSSHREFIVVSVGGGGEWMPERLAHEGYRAQLVSAGETTIYKVTVR